MKGRIPVDGHKDYMTSYRTELASILAALLRILELMGNDIKFYNQITGMLWCDNMTAVNKYLQLEGKTPQTMKETNEDDNDILQELRKLKEKLPKGIQCAWVKGHQMGGKTKESRLNNIVEKIADSQLTVKGKFRSRNNTTLMPAQHALLLHKGTAVTAQLDKLIQQFLWRDKLEKYFFKQLNIDPEQSDNIDFESLTKFNKSLSKQLRCTRAKFVFGWIPTNQRLYKYNAVDNPKCPMCKEEENTAHISRCKSTQAT